MRYFRISATETFEAPDSASIVDNPEGGLCVQADGSYWEPAIIWMRYEGPSTPLVTGASEGFGSWTQDDDGPSDFVTISADSDFSMISEQEAYSFMGED
jgi:hypothetical protein